MAVNEGTRRSSAAWIPIRIFTSQRSWMSRIGFIETRSFATTRQGYSADARPGCGHSVTCNTSVPRVQLAAMAQAFSVSCSKPGLRFSRSQPRTSRIAADVARTTISMLRTWPMPCLCRPADRDAAKPGAEMIESLRVRLACRKTAVSARRVCSANDPQYDPSALPTAFAINCAASPACQLVRTLAPWRPDLTAYRDVEFRLSHRPQVPGPPLPRTA